METNFQLYREPSVWRIFEFPGDHTTPQEAGTVGGHLCCALILKDSKIPSREPRLDVSLHHDRRQQHPLYGAHALAVAVLSAEWAGRQGHWPLQVSQDAALPLPQTAGVPRPAGEDAGRPAAPAEPQEEGMARSQIRAEPACGRRFDRRLPLHVL